MANYGYNYLAPLSPKQLRRQVRQSVNAQVGPFLGQINRAETQGSGMIAAYSDALAHQLLDAQRQTRENYGQAEASQASINAALANRLSGQGAALSNDLASQLAAAGQSTGPSSAVGAIGSGAANAGYASGSASLSALLAQGAAAQQFAGQLPNLARMQGIQQQGLFLQQQEKNRGDLLAKVPGLIDSESKQALANEFQKAVAIQSGLVDQQKLQLDTQYKSAKLQQGQQALGLKASKQRTDAALKAAGLAETRRYHNLSVRAREVANDIAAYRAHHPSSRRSGGKSGFTPSQVAKFRSQGTEAAVVLKKEHDFTPIQAYRYFKKRGMPPRIAAEVVGNVFGQWLKPGDKKKLGIR